MLTCCLEQTKKQQKSCNDCYHCIEVAEDTEVFYICGLHNMEVEQEYCGLFEVRNEQGI